jgi:FkbM family methyltransferase
VRPITQRRFIALNADAAETTLLREQYTEMREQNREIREQNREIREQNTEMQEQNTQVRDQNALLHEQNALLREQDTAMRDSLPQAAELRRQLDVAAGTIVHLRRVEHQYKQIATVLDQIASHDPSTGTAHRAVSGVQAFVDKLQQILFECGETTPQSRSAATLVLGDQPVNDAIATLINLSEPLHGARPFQYLLPFFAPSVPFPLPWPDRAPPLRIVDVGSQELSFERDMHAPLRVIAPVQVIGFDPFTAPGDAPGGAVEVHRPDGGTIRTYPYLLADGAEVTFHVNRFDATSSTLPSNHELARHFGLLDQSLETVETRKLPSRRLDDVLDETTPVDLLKIDVQGTTHTVLDHARRLLNRTLVCHVEAEFAPIYLGERLFADIDTLLREAGFAFVDFFSLGRQRYACFDTSNARAFHRGRILWADCVYVRGLDAPDGLTAEELFRAALIVHACYNKQDLAAELLRRSDALTGGASLASYISGLTAERTA